MRLFLEVASTSSESKHYYFFIRFYINAAFLFPFQFLFIKTTTQIFQEYQFVFVFLILFRSWTRFLCFILKDLTLATCSCVSDVAATPLSAKSFQLFDYKTGWREEGEEPRDPLVSSCLSPPLNPPRSVFRLFNFVGFFYKYFFLFGKRIFTWLRGQHTTYRVPSSGENIPLFCEESGTKMALLSSSSCLCHAQPTGRKHTTEVYTRPTLGAGGEGGE